MKVHQKGDKVLCEVRRPGVQPLCQSHEEHVDEKHGEEYDGMQGKCRDFLETTKNIGHLLKIFVLTR